MEDPNRMRTRLRLDLNDVAKQIADLEELMEKDKTEKLIEDHRKLVEYEKKLKEQYEKMTGLSIEQATSGSSRKEKKADNQPRKLARFFGFLAGITLLAANFNLTMHGIKGDTINDFLDYFMGSGDQAYPTITGLVAALKYEYSLNIIIVTMTLPILFTILESLFSKYRKEIYSVPEGIAITLPVMYLLFELILPNTEKGLENGMLTLDILLISSGILMMISGFGGNLLNKIVAILAGAMYLFSAYMVYISFIDGNVETRLMQNWPYIFMPQMVVGLIMAIAFAFGIIKD
ncbi:MAG: hypothetical protein INQ03_09540 [Candidatus Heimdallarchaeota archaeon]|nr:hypothetical protein [Candidatus Heimdallarchaeota archaeon]